MQNTFDRFLKAWGGERLRPESLFYHCCWSSVKHPSPLTSNLQSRGGHTPTCMQVLPPGLQPWKRDDRCSASPDEPSDKVSLDQTKKASERPREVGTPTWKYVNGEQCRTPTSPLVSEKCDEGGGAGGGWRGGMTSKHFYQPGTPWLRDIPTLIWLHRPLCMNHVQGRTGTESRPVWGVHSGQKRVQKGAKCSITMGGHFCVILVANGGFPRDEGWRSWRVVPTGEMHQHDVFGGVCL